MEGLHDIDDATKELALQSLPLMLTDPSFLSLVCLIDFELERLSSAFDLAKDP
jgi:hypothetical protein